MISPSALSVKASSTACGHDLPFNGPEFEMEENLYEKPDGVLFCYKITLSITQER
jgi:hypothetical protein